MGFCSCVIQEGCRRHEKKDEWDGSIKIYQDPTAIVTLATSPTAGAYSTGMYGLARYRVATQDGERWPWPPFPASPCISGVPVGTREEMQGSPNDLELQGCHELPHSCWRPIPSSSESGVWRPSLARVNWMIFLGPVPHETTVPFVQKRKKKSSVSLRVCVCLSLPIIVFAFAIQCGCFRSRPSWGLGPAVHLCTGVHA